MGKFWVISIFLLISSHVCAKARTCSVFLEPEFELPFDEWPVAHEYREFNQSLSIIKNEESVAKVITLYKTFLANYSDRYNRQMQALIQEYPELDRNVVALRNSLNSFYRVEKKALTRVQNEILFLPAKKRMQFLKRLTPAKLLQVEDLLDALFGLSHPSAEMTQPSWSSLIHLIETTDFKSRESVVEVGSSEGRFGLLMGLLHPDISYLGFESSRDLVFESSEAVRKNGLISVAFQEVSLEDPALKLPEADYYFSFKNLTAAAKANIEEILFERNSRQRLQGLNYE